MNALDFALSLAVGVLGWGWGHLRVTTYSPIMLLDSGLCSWVALTPPGLVRKSMDKCLV